MIGVGITAAAGLVLIVVGIRRWAHRDQLVADLLSRVGDSERSRRSAKRAVPATAIGAMVGGAMFVWAALVGILRALG